MGCRLATRKRESGSSWSFVFDPFRIGIRGGRIPSVALRLPYGYCLEPLRGEEFVSSTMRVRKGGAANIRTPNVGSSVLTFAGSENGRLQVPIRIVVPVSPLVPQQHYLRLVLEEFVDAAGVSSEHEACELTV